MVKFISVLALLTLTACGSSVPQDIVDVNQGISRANAQKNANSYFAVVWPEGMVDAKSGSKPMRIVMQSDSTISSSCRYGDGWTTGDLQFENGKSVKIKCQTNGSGKGINGCMTDSEFQSKTYKEDDGRCQNLSALPKF